MDGNTSNISPLQKLAYEIVSEIIEMKQGSVEPCMAHINEIRNSFNIELMEALRVLYRKGILSCSTDINKNPMFQIKNQL